MRLGALVTAEFWLHAHIYLVQLLQECYLHLCQAQAYLNFWEIRAIEFWEVVFERRDLEEITWSIELSITVSSYLGAMVTVTTLGSTLYLRYYRLARCKSACRPADMFLNSPPVCCRAPTHVHVYILVFWYVSQHFDPTCGSQHLRGAPSESNLQLSDYKILVKTPLG